MDREKRTVTGGFFCFRMEAGTMGKKKVNGISPVFHVRLNNEAMGLLKNLAEERKSENLSGVLRSLIYEVAKDDKQGNTSINKHISS